MSIFRRQRNFFSLFLLATAKSALSILTVECHVFLISLSLALRNLTSAYGASPLRVSRASRSAVASFSQLEADRKVLEWAHRRGSTGPVASNSPPSLLLLLL